MKSASLLCLAFLFLIFISTWSPVSAQCRDLVSPSTLLDELSRDIQLAPPGEGVDNNLRVVDVYTSCIASASVRGELTEVSHPVNLTGVPNRSGFHFGIVDLRCFDGRWVLNSDKPFKFISNETDIQLLKTNNTIQTDCWHCNAPNHRRFPLSPSNDDDLLRHCDRCPDECLNASFAQTCHGTFRPVCCNVYVRESGNSNRLICAESCPTNFSASPETNFTCECSLGCRNGGRSNTQCNGCICPRQITGAFCQNVPNPCEPNPCNNGTCRALSFTNFTCTCPPGFTGRNCSTKLNPCEPNPCRNNGVCMPAGTYPNFTCTCPPRFTGRLCETDICSNITCLNGGLCEILNGRAVCRCSANFNGSRCENCTIPNCRSCSTILTGVCLECERGFTLANGRCSLDCNRCQEIANGDQRNICYFFCELSHWNNVSKQCNVDPPDFNIPSASLPISTQYSSAVAATKEAEATWVRLATFSAVLPRRPNETLETWRNGTRHWLNNLKSWLIFIRTIDSSFTNYNLDNLLVNIDDDQKIQEVYNGIRVVWTQIFNEFNTKKKCSS